MKIVQLLFKVARNTYSISRLRLLKLGYGKRFQVGQDVVVRYGFTVRMEDRLDSRIQIGSGTFFNDGRALNSMYSIVIGDKCLFGQGVKIYDVIYKGVDSRRFSQTNDDEIKNVRKDFGCTDDTNLCGHVAQFSSPKNQAFTLDLTASMLDYPQYRFVFVGGQGEDFDKVVSEAACRGLEKKVIFAGQRSDMPQVMSVLDCLVLPSLPGEGFPMTVVEAVAAGTPCIVFENVTAETQMLGSEFVSRCSLSVGDWTNALLHIGRKTSEMRSMGPLRIFQCHLDLESFGKAWRNLYRWNE